jgi:hypothetical protein
MIYERVTITIMLLTARMCIEQLQNRWCGHRRQLHGVNGQSDERGPAVLIQ